MQETWVWSLGWENLLENGMTTHSSILAWRIPGTEEPRGLQSTESQRVGHNWSDLALSTTSHLVVKTECFPPKIKNTVKIFIFTIHTGSLNKCSKARKKKYIKRHTCWKGKIKTVGRQPDYLHKFHGIYQNKFLLELINELIEVAGYKINI